MTARVTHHLAKTTGTAPCSRCFDTVAVIGGQWIAAAGREGLTDARGR